MFKAMVEVAVDVLVCTTDICTRARSAAKTNVNTIVTKDSV